MHAHHGGVRVRQRPVVVEGPRPVDAVHPVDVLLRADPAGLLPVHPHPDLRAVAGDLRAQQLPAVDPAGRAAVDAVREDVERGVGADLLRPGEQLPGAPLDEALQPGPHGVLRLAVHERPVHERGQSGHEHHDHEQPAPEGPVQCTGLRGGEGLLGLPVLRHRTPVRSASAPHRARRPAGPVTW
ncbi:hypothetical protein AUQ48_03500 [Kocuria flava]|uniref:Uncharacterized protein n=1 Tax=Kocuria flava TaxID=446860 RepID=A0A2N4SZT0_9MICC|nr:hypothetical protein AUQ48_03500 [Kocuria flava]